MTNSIRLFSICLGASALLVAADFWEKKKFPDWSEKEAQKIMKDSPWAKPVEFGPPSGPGLSGSPGGRGGRGGGGGTVPSVPEVSGTGAGGLGRDGTEGSGAGMGGGSSPSRPAAIVRWQSALPIRQAAARIKFGAEAATSADAGKMLAKAENYYIIAVSGIPIRPTDPKALLEIRGKDPIQSVNVQAGKDANSAVLYFVFPRTPITLEDKEVEFVFKLGSTDLRRRFRLKDMVFEGNLEL
jgi:hypothetical protein